MQYIEHYMKHLSQATRSPAFPAAAILENGKTLGVGLPSLTADFSVWDRFLGLRDKFYIYCMISFIF